MKLNTYFLLIAIFKSAKKLKYFCSVDIEKDLNTHNHNIKKYLDLFVLFGLLSSKKVKKRTYYTFLK